MKETSLIKQLEFSMLPFDENTLNWNNDLLLDDNLKQSHRFKEATERHSQLKKSPIKINFALFIMCVKGKASIRINMAEHTLIENMAMLIFPGAVAEMSIPSGDCVCILIAFSKKAYDIGTDGSGILLAQKHFRLNPLVQLQKEQMQECTSYYLQMREKIASETCRFKKDFIKGYMQLIFGTIMQNLPEEVKKVPQRNRSEHLFSQFIKAVEKDFIYQRSISYYANQLCITPKYLSQVIYNVSGRHAGDWIKDYVIIEAKALLRSGKYTVQQVGDMLNFANPSFFGKYFKAAVGMSPRRFQTLKEGDLQTVEEIFNLQTVEKPAG